MCMFKAPKIKAPPPPAQMQAMQLPKDVTRGQGRNRLRRRGMWASIFTTPAGLPGAPMTTGGSGGVTGG